MWPSIISVTCKANLTDHNKISQLKDLGTLSTQQALLKAKQSLL